MDLAGSEIGAIGSPNEGGGRLLVQVKAFPAQSHRTTCSQRARHAHHKTGRGSETVLADEVQKPVGRDLADSVF